MDNHRTYSMMLQSERSQVNLVEPFLKSIPELQLLGPQRFYNLHVSLTEAVNNAIIHGHNCKPEMIVNVDVLTSPTEVVVVIRDFGEGFDPGSIPDPRLPGNLLLEGGRGVFLMNHLADSVEYRRADPGFQVLLKYLLQL